MILYEMTISPTSLFGTPIKGDTLFGQFCWQAAHDPDLVTGGLHNVLSEYEEKPFVIFSSAFPKASCSSGPQYFFPRPMSTIAISGKPASSDRREIIENRKRERAKKWMVVNGNEPLNASSRLFLNDEELHDIIFDSGSPSLAQMTHTERNDLITIRSQPHNSIDRTTGTTGKSAFAPFTTEVFCYLPGTEMVLFILVDNSKTDIERVSKGIKQIGMWGFGRDASTGMGRFTVGEVREIALPVTKDTDAMYVLAPVVPEKNAYRNLFFTPFIRYGKHGDSLAASAMPFKKPVIMADEGAVLIPGDEALFSKPWVGTAIRGTSCVQPETVAQGYAPWLPIKLES